MRRIPILPTIIVLAAVATMIALGVWQLGRADEKAALIARSEAALADDRVVLTGDFAEPDAFYRRARFTCEDVKGIEQVSGRNGAGQAGWAHVARCPATDGTLVELTLGWSRNLQNVRWTGGYVEGRVAPADGATGRLVADPPVAGLEPNAAPNPKDIPNNHLAYAGQWFFFALTALVIYAFALRRRRREDEA